MFERFYDWLDDSVNAGTLPENPNERERMTQVWAEHVFAYVNPSSRDNLRRCVERQLADGALKRFIAQHIEPEQWRESPTLAQPMSRWAFGFIRQWVHLIRKSIELDAARTFEGTPEYSFILFHLLLEKSHAVIHDAVARALPDQVKAAAVNPASARSDFTADEASAVRQILERRQPPAQLVDETTFLLLFYTLGMFHRHRFVAAVTLDLSIMSTVFSLDEFEDHARAGGRGINPDAYKAAWERLQDRLTGPTARVHARLGGSGSGSVLLTPPADWETLRQRMDEHFPAVSPAFEGEPPSDEDWEWLKNDAHYLVIFSADAPVNAAKTSGEHILRRLNGLARCFRDGDQSISEYADAGWGHEASLTGATVRVLAMPEQEPAIWGITDHTPVGKDLPRPDVESVQKWEVRLPGCPVLNAEEMAQLDAAGMGTAWEWLASEESLHQREVREALELFETAYTLGETPGISDPVAQVWRCIGYTACLESLFCGKEERRGRSGIVLDRIERRLKGDPEVSADDAGAHSAAIRRLYQVRDSGAHGSGGADHFNATGESATAAMTHAVAATLRSVIKERMVNPKKPQ